MTDYTIKELPEQYRPRERLLGNGAKHLSDQELIGIILRIGNTSSTAVQLGEQLLYEFENLQTLSIANPIELTKIDGIGTAKAAQIAAAFELGRRANHALKSSRVKIKEPIDIFNLLSFQMKNLDREHFYAVLLNTKNHVLGAVQISIGTLNASLVHPRELFKDAIKHSANAVVLAHNHPSGEKQPSREDIDLTKRLCEVGNLIGIQIIDHLIITETDFFSFKENGLM